MNGQVEHDVSRRAAWDKRLIGKLWHGPSSKLAIVMVACGILGMTLLLRMISHWTTLPILIGLLVTAFRPTDLARRTTYRLSPRAISRTFGVMSWVVASIGILGWEGIDQPADTQPARPSPRADQAATAPEMAKTPPKPLVRQCDATTTITNRDIAVRTEADAVVRTEPNAQAATLPWKVGDEFIPFQIDDSIRLREQCRVKGWSKIKMVGPYEMRHFEGWVPSGVLRTVNVDRKGRWIYAASDIEWPEGSSRYRSQVLTIINRIRREDQRCEAIVTDQLMVETDQGTPQFHIPCDGAEDMVSISFSPWDAARGRSFRMALRDRPVPTTPIGKVDAINACEERMKQELLDPSIDFDSFTSTVFSTNDALARVTIDMTFTNAFGQPIRSRAECTFEGEQLLTAAQIPRL